MREHKYARITPQSVMNDFPIGTVLNYGTDKWESGREDKVEGYVFDGTYWYPAHDSWDGWYPYYGDDGETFQPVDSDKDLEWLTEVKIGE